MFKSREREIHCQKKEKYKDHEIKEALASKGRTSLDREEHQRFYFQHIWKIWCEWRWKTDSRRVGIILYLDFESKRAWEEPWSQWPSGKIYIDDRCRWRLIPIKGGNIPLLQRKMILCLFYLSSFLILNKDGIFYEKKGLCLLENNKSAFLVQ